MITVAALLSACAAPVPPVEPNDPDEAKNREIHAFNIALDKAILRPTSSAYGAIVPEPVKIGVSNFAENLELPGDAVNGALQLRPHHVLENTLRFVINSTVGIAGLFDPASAIGLPGKDTDFGETLHVWGVGEGSYMELPGLGPSTGRDTMGTIVDFAMNPVGRVLPKPESYVGTGAKVLSKLGDRDRYSETIDSVLYDSADSYAQTRLLYLQNRRFELGQTASSEDSFIDPYEE
ncbi:VacJ family lipoprotein [Aliigemmobacter aestuarii]|uniref:VacJ family lipoprotein n=1 Tax=Aliigemmobacter aestuarii TaxID=1445661 RepID=A0A4S3MS13_9RHOB|nr:VacJ family lipoprotein [Gemmobacter aestuarii]THD85328.1 VacJ family lipoprotein [Gemmobacter aestuarii]